MPNLLAAMLSVSWVAPFPPANALNIPCALYLSRGHGGEELLQVYSYLPSCLSTRIKSFQDQYTHLAAEQRNRARSLFSFILWLRFVHLTSLETLHSIFDTAHCSSFFLRYSQLMVASVPIQGIGLLSLPMLLQDL